MNTFFSVAQMICWIERVRPGDCSVLKQVEHGMNVVYAVRNSAPRYSTGRTMNYSAAKFERDLIEQERRLREVTA